MAAFAEEVFVNNMDTETDSKLEKSTVFGWIFEYCCYVFWEEFQDHFTVDSASERRLLEGIPMYSIQSTASRNSLAHFVSLLTRLADGLEHNTEYDTTDDSDGCGTPLEGAIQVLHSLMDIIEEDNIDKRGQVQEAARNLELDIQTEAVLVCCRAGDYNTGGEVFERLWAGKEWSKAQKGVMATLNSALRKKSVKQLPSNMTWENFQEKAIENLSVIYEYMRVDEPFLHKASRKFLESRKQQRASSISTPSLQTSTHNSRHIPMGRLQAVGRKLGCTNLEDETTDFMKELKRIREQYKKTPNKKLTKPAVSPIEVNNNNSAESTDTSDDEIVTSTPHPNTIKDRLHGTDVPKESISSSPSWKDRPSTSKEKTRRDRPSTPKDNEWRNKPSTSKDQPRKERQSSSRERPPTMETDVNNKENNSPKRGKQIRDQVYQPGRVTRSKDTPPNEKANKKKYIEWSSSDSEDDDRTTNIFKTELPHKKVRKSLDLEVDGAVQYHQIRKPAQRVPWTADEEERLRRGVAKYGKGKWAVIKDKCDFVIRTSVNLKDKWRNMEKDAKSVAGEADS
ncbi:uncharacterized protein [Amphiura filiformis]|uniref:uncharacterized protein isoform X2 n=1 Tax=Amphiura filiformis TaxID=82378 RepID=UPI003B21DEE3